MFSMGRADRGNDFSNTLWPEGRRKDYAILFIVFDRDLAAVQAMPKLLRGKIFCETVSGGRNSD